MPLCSKLMSDLLTPRSSRFVESENNHISWTRLERFGNGNGVTANLSPVGRVLTRKSNNSTKTHQ
jgi:hypothetical protein